MKPTVSEYALKVFLATMSIGLVSGGAVMYYLDISRNNYDNNWDNPFANLLFYLLISVPESIIPVSAFLLATKLIVKFRAPKLIIYLAGIICTTAPFVQLYWMVNPGEHRVNVLIYSACFLFSLVISLIIFRKYLNSLYIPELI